MAGYRRTLSLLLAATLGCGAEPREPGYASVGGTVARASGGAWAGATVEVHCPRLSEPLRTSATAEGTFLVSVVVPGALAAGSTTPTMCYFAAPSLAAPRAQASVTLTLYRAGNQPLQSISLREQP